jgi:hypothetical protein
MKKELKIENEELKMKNDQLLMIGGKCLILFLHLRESLVFLGVLVSLW